MKKGFCLCVLALLKIDHGEVVQVFGCHLPPLSGALVLVPIAHLGDSASIVRCQLREESDYTRKWSGYPRRRKRISEVAEEYPADADERGPGAIPADQDTTSPTVRG